MCLITKQQQSETATTDIPVWKVLDSDLKSLFMDFQYKDGVVYQQDIELITEEDYNNRELLDRVCAYDGAVYRKYGKGLCSDVMNPNFVYIEKGFHAFTNRERGEDGTRSSAYGIYNDIMAEFIIPEGSEYYEDETGLIVSNHIIMQKHKIPAIPLYKSEILSGV